MTFADRSQTRDLASLVRRRSEWLAPTGDEAFDVFAEAKVILLGECTHGTAEFYEVRISVDGAKGSTASGASPDSSTGSAERTWQRASRKSARLGAQ